MSKPLQFKFPKRFLWGAAISSHQVEGNQHNQWSVWELENARALAAKAPYEYGDLENWPEIEAETKDPSTYVSGKGANHYELYEQDIELAQQLGLNTFRFSIEWSRIQPKMDAWDLKEVEHYRQVLLALKKRNIEPVVTLFHFTLPIWFAELGGFEKAKNVKYFAQFAERIMRELGGTVKYVITINEPEVYATQSYSEGNWPPQGQNKWRMRRVLLNLAYAHNTVAKQLHAASRRYKVSIAKNSVFIYPGDDSWLSVRIAALEQYFQDDFLLKRVIKHCDFIGVNYYFSSRVYGYRMHNPDDRLNDLGWDMQPQHLERVLERLSDKYDKPILVTENGLADSRDQYRKWWLMQSLAAMQRAMDNGVDLIGYIHWSLIDNFEWSHGYWPRFGMAEVDYKTFKRTPRPSAVWFAGVIKKFQREGK